MVAQVKAERLGPALPERIGRYRILAPIGAGGMASVVLACADGAAGFERKVAIKLLHPHLMLEPEIVRQFLTEARVAARIQHSNVVAVHDACEPTPAVPWAYLVMEHVPGDSLLGLCALAEKRGDDLPPRIWLRILCDALTGLEAAHEATAPDGSRLGIVHRDFTPHNILVGSDGVAKLSDFGIVKVASAVQHTATGIVKGKPRYLAPEQLRGRDVDRRSDVWSAGVLAWEMFTGKRLHESADLVHLLLKIATTEPTRLRSAWSAAPAALDDTIAWALTREIGDRCPSALVFRDRLVAAWQHAGGDIATQQEVAHYVRHACRERLERLEASPTQVVEESAAFSTVTSLRRMEEVVSSPQPTETMDAAALPTSTAGARPRSRRHWLIAALALPALALWIATRGVETAQRIEGGAFTVAIQVPSAAPSASSSSLPAREPTLLRVQANEPIVALTVAGRTIDIAAPARELEVRVEEQPGSVVQLVARSARGRQLTRSITVAAGVVELTFVPPPQQTAKRVERPPPVPPNPFE